MPYKKRHTKETPRYFNKPPLTETLAKKMQIAVGMAGIFPPIVSKTVFKPDWQPKNPEVRIDRNRKQRCSEQEIRGE